MSDIAVLCSNSSGVAEISILWRSWIFKHVGNEAYRVQQQPFICSCGTQFSDETNVVQIVPGTVTTGSKYYSTIWLLTTSG